MAVRNGTRERMRADIMSAPSNRGNMAFVIAALGLALTTSVSAMTPGGVQKKFVALCFDTMFNTPSNVLDHADLLDQVPWLDGLAISLKDIEIPTTDGTTVTSDTWRVVQRGHRWTRESIAPQLKYCREIVKHPSLKESFLLVWNTPSGKHNRIFWNDDDGWRLFTENIANLAWFAREAGFKGLMIDSEEYAGARQFSYVKGDADSYDECAALARRRGREVFSAVFKEYPDITLFFLWLFEDMVRHNSILGEMHPADMAQQAGRLRHHFLNGMFDVVPPTVKFIDGAEHYWFSARNHAWWKGGISQFVGSKTFIDPANLGKFRSQLSMSHGHYLDMYSIHSKPGGWYHSPLDGSRLEHMRLNFVESLESADEYIWIYGESGRLIDWKGGPTRHQSGKYDLWERQIPGMTETLLLTKDPDKLMAMRMKELKKKGELRNLVGGAVKLPQSFSGEDKERVVRVDPLPVVKDVKSGDLYALSVSMKATAYLGIPHCTVKWRANGKPFGGWKEERPLSFRGKRSHGVWRSAYSLVRVPKGADELVFDVGATIHQGEAFTFDKIKIFKVGDAIPPWPSEK